MQPEYHLSSSGSGKGRVPVKKLGFRPTLKQQMRTNQAVERFCAGAAPEHKQAAAQERVEQMVDIDAAHKKRAAPRQLEAPVVAAIAELLAVHPLVLFACRQNSGMASYEAKSGRYAPVFFYKILTHRDVTIPDFWGILRGGRMFSIEAKAPGFKEPRADREFKQANFLALVRNCGGRAGFATSAEAAKAIIEG